MSNNSKKTSKSVGSLAVKVLRDDNASAIQKQLAGSALSQIKSNNQTGVAIETKASEVLKSNRYNETTKSLAASVLSQSNKER